MGGQFSKKTASELRSYETACKLDPELQTFDSALQVRTNRVINTLAVGVEVRALSLNSLKEVTTCLLEMNQEVVKVILDCKEDIWETKQVLELVEEYFDNSLQTLDFCTTLEKCLKNARDRQLIIHVALQQFEDEDNVDGSKYLKTLDELKSFKAAGDPFTDDFFGALKAVYGQHVLMLEKLQLRRSKLDTKIKCIKTWRKVSCIIFAVAFASILICSVVAAVAAAPPVAAALAAATSVPIGSMGKWFESFWNNCEVTLKGQREIITSMQAGTYIAIKDLDSIRVLVDRLEREIESLLYAADFSLKEEEAVKIGIEEIKKNLAFFMQSIEDLGEHADMCSRDVRRARTVILQRISKQPNK